MSKKNDRNQGFTLIEILVTLVIIGLLSTVGLRSFMSSQQRSRDAKRKSDLKQIGVALETYYNDKNQYPVSSGGDIVGCDDGAGGVTTCTWGEEFSDFNGTVYMVKLPDDVRAGYYYVSDGTEYQIYARLENTQDIDVPQNTSDEPQVYPGTSCGSEVCNYGTASSNSSLVTPVDE